MTIPPANIIDIGSNADAGEWLASKPFQNVSGQLPNGAATAPFAPFHTDSNSPEAKANHA